MKKIRRRIKEFPIGVPFGYFDFGLLDGEFPAAAKAFGRLVESGEIMREAPGIFYRARITPFGPSRLSEEILVSTYLVFEGKRCAYITGVGLFNQLGLTTQVPQVLQVACYEKRISAQVGNLRLKPVRSYVQVSDKNISLLELLDVIKEFKNIPDIDSRLAISYLKKRIETLQTNQISMLVKIALKYPPRVRAMLGALLSTEKPEISIGCLRASLHPLSKYDFGLSDADFAAAGNWNII